MKRNWELIRGILLQLESQETARPESVIVCDIDSVAYHMWLLDQAELIITCFLDDGDCIGLSITPEGISLLDKIRDDSVWDAIKKTASQKEICLSTEAIELISDLLIKA